MKLLFLSIHLSIVLLCTSCNKDKSGTTTIILKDKPLSEIKSHIEGRWQLHKISGGFCGCSQLIKNEFYQFGNDRIKWEVNNMVVADTTVTWMTFNYSGDSSWTIHYFDKRLYPYSFGFSGIYNDTLLLYQPGPDGAYFHLTKSR